MTCTLMHVCCSATLELLRAIQKLIAQSMKVCNDLSICPVLQLPSHMSRPVRLQPAKGLF